MLITKSVKVKIINFNVNLYREKGYKCNIGDIIDVKVEDVSEHSKQKVKILCDECKEEIKEITIESLHKSKSYKNGQYVCEKCTNKILNNRKCEVCGSTHKVTNYLNQGILLCQRHQRMMRDRGEIRRTTKDKNEIRIYDDYAEFDTYNIKGVVNGTYKIDLDIVDFVKAHKLHKHKDGYACYKFKDKNGKTKNMRLHRYIMNVHDKPDYLVVDHLNKDRKDDRRSNLRITDHLGNIVNTDLLCTNTSGHKGISWNKKANKWEAYIHQNNKKINLGRYTDYDRAVKVRELAEIIYFGNKNPEYNNLINKYINEPQIQNLLLKHKGVDSNNDK